MAKSMEALDKPVSLGKGFLSGNYWKSMKWNDPIQAAQRLGLGILFENGTDLTVVFDRGS
jgi:hypothetical protein